MNLAGPSPRSPVLGHLLSDPVSSQLLIASIAITVVALAALHARHRRVKHGDVSGSRDFGVQGVVVVAALIATVVAVPQVQARQTGSLPDLISDPPVPAFLKVLREDDGERRLVLTFDGYIHNIGDGPLDLVGNPQEPDGMVQRVRNGADWNEVANPTVRYETDDGHNHFHLIEAVDYVLWNESVGAQTALGSKIGFCLVDSEQTEPGTDQAYSEELDNFCQENNPTATSLRMGISPGWRDIYDATTTLQWVDVTDAAPGRYWIGAITDPNDEIVESNEDNNELIFSTRPAVVPGWLPVGVEATTDGEAIDIALPARAFGTVGERSFVIETGPGSGQIDAPTGAVLADGVVRYLPDSDFAGTDSFTFSVRSGASAFPATAPTATVTIEVVGGGTPQEPPPFPPGITVETTVFETEVGAEFDASVELGSITEASVELHVIGLPAGLRIEDSSLVGAATTPGVFEAELVAIADDGGSNSQTVTFVVNERETAGLGGAVDRSSPLMEPVQVTLGSPSLTSAFTASGLPDGLEIDPDAPVISGQPSEVGIFDVTVRQVDDGTTTATSSFRWTIRPSTAIDFVF